jgi:hypothetical protein
MDKGNVPRSPEEHEGERSAPLPSAGKTPWQEPKLAFVKPKLTKHGDLKEVTSGFFCSFVPG